MAQQAGRAVRVAIAGVGNCASSLVQAVAAARSSDAMSSDAMPGVVHPTVGPYEIGDIEFVAAFDVDARKVGRPLHEAVQAEPNCTTRYVDVPPTGVVVRPGPLCDGVGAMTADLVEVADEARTTAREAVAESLAAASADVLVCFLPVGSTNATASYAAAAIEAGVAFVNCNPERVATDPGWQGRFAAAGLPLLGDDVKSQLGATTLHRTLLDLCRSRGAAVDRTYQMNAGGNSDFLNMLDPTRAANKRGSKLAALAASLGDASEVSAGPSDHIHFMRDFKVAYIRIEGRSLLGMPFSIETRLQVEDSPNAAGVVVDAVRAAKVAADRGRAGPVEEVCAFLFKRPPVAYADAEADELMARFAAGDVEARPPRR